MLPMLLTFAATACVAGVLCSLFLGWVGATDDSATSWSDPEPRQMLWLAVAFGVAAVLFAVAGFVIARRNRSAR
jgi:hypothetical protein